MKTIEIDQHLQLLIDYYKRHRDEHFETGDTTAELKANIAACDVLNYLLIVLEPQED